ncbi:hypothetical protein HELRODRAFT_170242 [Helobdella robusta]|uniref:Uncharacterized protein n=1 Tax=Helobdella robusta TaxID=6412 RepID=T1F2T6_HELRO|nr:hypothetical protein HELRODRAFT_170242 [Helobdella robusta]ESO07704.1 hypothetical protein HELRODRAFT_170242 [Helobdella robusta]
MPGINGLYGVNIISKIAIKNTRRNRCNKHEMWLVAKNSSLLSPDLTLIILHIASRNLRVLGSIGPRTSIHIEKNSIEGRAFPYFFILDAVLPAALAAATAFKTLGIPASACGT